MQVGSEARSKLAQVRYHLVNLKAAHDRSDGDVVRWEVSSFQNASYSVMQRMLYDAAEIFGLGVTLADYLNPERFGKLAKKQKNVLAEEFLEWWNGKNRELDQNPVWRLRDIDTHRGDPELHQVQSSIYVSGYSSGEVTDPRYTASHVASRSGGTNYWGPPSSLWRNFQAKKQFQS
jgi:hypothetical protein